MSALNVTIDPSIKGAWPEARLGCFIYTADVRAREDSLWTCLENEVAPYLKTIDRKSTRLNSSHIIPSRMPSSA